MARFLWLLLLAVEFSIIAADLETPAFPQPLDASTKELVKNLEARNIPLPVDQEALMTVPEIIRSYGYPVEEHQVVTADGYILTLHRIPHGRNETAGSNANSTRPIVFLQHGLLCSSSMWVLNLPHQSAGFVFADAGYDVWMGNSRGNIYARRHVRLSPEDDAFWRFSWQQMAEYDLPASIDGILLFTKQPSLYYVGHSQGSLTMFTKLSVDPAFAPKIRKFFALAPVARLSHPKGAFHYLGKLYDQAKAVLAIFGDGQFLRNNMLTRILADLLCDAKFSSPLCTNLIFAISGPDSHQFNATRVPIYLAHNPAGTSMRTIVHYAQMVHFKRFAPYDLGQERNQRIYGAPFAPEYDISAVAAPTYLFYSDADYLATPEDVEGFIMRRLNSTTLRVATKLSDFNHNDFMWGLRARSEVYDPIVNIIQHDIRRQEIQHTLQSRKARMLRLKYHHVNARMRGVSRRKSIEKPVKEDKDVETTATPITTASVPSSTVTTTTTTEVPSTTTVMESSSTTTEAPSTSPAPRTTTESPSTSPVPSTTTSATTTTEIPEPSETRLTDQETSILANIVRAL